MGQLAVTLRRREMSDGVDKSRNARAERRNSGPATPTPTSDEECQIGGSVLCLAATAMSEVQCLHHSAQGLDCNLSPYDYSIVRQVRSVDSSLVMPLHLAVEFVRSRAVVVAWAMPMQ